MRVTLRDYRHQQDYARVYRFLGELYQPDDRLPSWLPARWEYMHGHALIERIALSSIGVAEMGHGRIVGVVHPEHVPQERYLQVRPGHEAVRPLLLDWAEQHPADPGGSAAARVAVFVDDADRSWQDLMAARGYVRSSEARETHARLRLDLPLPEARCPAGYRLTNLAEEDDPTKVHHVLWRGFDHDGEPPTDGRAERERAQRTPHFRQDLNLVAVEPGGAFVSYAGLWHMRALRVAYVEPVATDPGHRRRGLARALLAEGLRRVREEGATTAWVGSDQALYRELGFEVTASSSLWQRLGREGDAVHS
ncbi:MAG: GNAT family N-acetyltransferase [Chloroflexota bacterium]